ncbi:hypothetical protein AgCh_033967, partial [Apium graveolens]
GIRGRSLISSDDPEQERATLDVRSAAKERR